MITLQLLVILTIITAGIICASRKVFNANQIEGFQIFLFKISMPCYLFSSISQYNLSGLINLQYIYSYLISFAIVAIIVTLFFYRLDKSSEVCIKILCSGYVNTGIYTLPIITFLLGNPFAGILANLLQVIIIQSMFMVILNIFNHKQQSIALSILIIFTTPLIALPLIALICNYLEFNLPSIITGMIKGLGSGASSIALFAFGLVLGSIKISKKMINKNLLSIVFVKTVAHPIIACCFGKYVFHLDGYWLYSLLIATSGPTAFVVYRIATHFSIEQHLVKNAMALSSIISLFSLVSIAMLLN